jgi:hypothetical protein
MTAVKTLALVALVIGTVAQGVFAGAMNANSIRWSSWSAASGASQYPFSYTTTNALPFVSVATAAPVVATPMPLVTGGDPNGGEYSARWGSPNNASTNAVSTSSTSSTSAAPTATASASPTPAASSSYDAFINMTGSNFAEAGNLVSGTPQAWYNSPVVAQVFGGTPNAQQQADFTAKVLADTQQVYGLSGVPVKLTTDPTATAAHTMSVISGASYGQIPQAIGITDVGANGFSFIDKFTGLQTQDQLAMAVAHNVAHELMHSFGIAVHHDPTGNYIDSATATNALLTNPNATFSPAAVTDLLSQNFQQNSIAGLSGAQVSAGLHVDGDQVLAVPEPTTIAMWTIALGGLVVARSRRFKSAA